MALLASHPERYVTNRQLVDTLDLPGPKSVLPTFRSLAARCRRCERRPV